MRNITLRADYGQYAIYDDYALTDVSHDLALPVLLEHKLEAWNAKYQRVLPLGPIERGEYFTRCHILELDSEGEALAAELGTHFPGAKVHYFSEGQDRAVTVQSRPYHLPPEE